MNITKMRELLRKQVEDSTRAVIEYTEAAAVEDEGIIGDINDIYNMSTNVDTGWNELIDEHTPESYNIMLEEG